MTNNKEIRIEYQKKIQRYLVEQKSFSSVDLRQYALIATELNLRFNVERETLNTVVNNIENSELSSLDKAKYICIAGLLFAIKNGQNYEFKPLEFQCPHCGEDVQVQFDGGRSSYVCTGNNCGAKVTLHKRHFWPMGSLALKDVREARAYCHERFDVIWKACAITRNAAYAEVARLLGIPRSLCHIGLIDTLHEAGRFIAAADSVKLRLDEKNAIS